MRRKHILPCGLSLLVFAAGVATAEGETGFRKTLLQWSYGTSFEGGPDVYEPLVTDRPDFTESSVTVGHGVAQLETGYTYVYDRDGGVRTRTHSFPETLLRIGVLAEWLELRVDWNYLDERMELGGAANTDSGAEDLGVGIKLALTPQECLLPETALILQTTLPTGSSHFTADEMLPGFVYLYSWELDDDWSTGGQTLVNRAVDGVTGETYVLIGQSWTVGRSLSERWGSYAEWFVLAPSGADTDPTEHYLNGGFTYLFNNDLQWDIRAGVGLNSAADDFFIGSGLSMRFW
jgi:hypothetical protein